MKNTMSREEWLTWAHPLTAQLECVAGTAQLTVLSQGWQLADAWESAQLDMQGIRVFRREIIISDGKAPCWYARTIIPEATYIAHTSLFQGLSGKMTVGDLIFRTPSVQRIHLTQPLLDLSLKAALIAIGYMPSYAQMRFSTMRVFASDAAASQMHCFYLAEIFLNGLARYTL
jgi:chorismate-pyruvate lyase